MIVLLCVGMSDFHHIHIVEAALGAIPLQKVFVDKLFCRHAVLIEFSAFQGESGLFEADAATLQDDGLESCGLTLVEVASTL